MLMMADQKGENMKKTTCKKIKIGDKVYRHEKGWAKVVGIVKSYFVYITFDNGDVIYYVESDKIIVSER